MSTRNPWPIPRKFENYVCSCNINTPRVKYTPTGWYMSCDKCGKVPFYDFYKCIDCESYFIQDFHWPYFCPWHPTCWDCSQDHNEAMEICIAKDGWPANESMRNMKVVPPRGANPKPILAEDYQGVFNFE